MKTIAVVCFALLSLSTSAVRAEITPEKKAEITKMLKLTGVEKMMSQMMGQMMSAFKSKDSTIPSEFWDKMEASFTASELLEKLMPVYDKNYTMEDLQAVNAFYSTPAGQHLLAAMPAVMQDSMKIGQDWGREVAEKVAKAMEKAKEGK